MLTIKQITENTEAVIRGLEKKHFKNAKETIEQVIALNDKRRSTQNQLDKNLAEVNSLSRTIGQLMKEGKKEEAETARARVAELKEGNKELDATMTQAATDMQNALYTIPNIPYDSVPEGVGAEDNVVEKMGGMETELPKDALPHWELAKKYDLIDFDLGVKITGAGFPVYKGKGAQLQRALINFFLDEARKSGYIEIMPPTVVNAASGYGTGQLPDKEGQMYHCEVDDLYLIPTAEVPVTNIYRDVILDEKELCIYTMFPSRSRFLWQGCAWLESPARILQSRIGAYRQTGTLQAISSGNARPCRRTAAKTGITLPHSSSLRRRHEFYRCALLRLRSILRSTKTLVGSKFRFQLRHLSGQPSEMPLS